MKLPSICDFPQLLFFILVLVAVFPPNSFMFILLLCCPCPRAPEFDMTELESLFAATIPTNGSTGGKSNRRGSGPKSDKVNLVI